MSERHGNDRGRGKGADEDASSPGEAAEPGAIAADVLAFHRESLVLDLHVDTLLWNRLFGYDPGKRHRNRLPGSPFFWHFDLPRAAEGGLDAMVFGLVVNPRRSAAGQLLALRLLARLESSAGIEQTLAMLDTLAATEARHADRFVFARSGSDVREAMRAGKFAGMAALEGAHGIEGDLAHLGRAYDRGLRMLGFVHFQATEAGFPMTVRGFDDRGLTPFGYDLLAEMERLGMVVDLAHLNPRGIDDALAVLARPFVVSHTGCRALYDHPRNLDDEQMRRIADKGGVIGIAFGRMFLGSVGLEGLLDQIAHVIDVGGADAVALGSDFDGGVVPIAPMRDVAAYPLITQGLLGRGFGPDTVRKILGENALRVLTEVCG